MPSEQFDELNINKGKGCWVFRDMRLGGGTTPRGDEELFSPVSNNIWFRGAIMRATFNKGRLWGLVPAVGGEMPGIVVTKNLTVSKTNTNGGILIINAATVRNGNIRIEILSKGRVVTEYSFQNNIPFEGDQTNAIVKWKNDVMIIKKDLMPVQIRFQLLRSRLYYFSLSDSM